VRLAAGCRASTKGRPRWRPPYDLLVTGGIVSDRDAGRHRGVGGNRNLVGRPQSPLQTITGGVYVFAAGRAAGRYVLAWRVPRGNQRYLSMKMTHLPATPPELVDSGIIGFFIFGPGVDSTTLWTRAVTVTNPKRGPGSTSQGGVADTCTRTSRSGVPDDDGSYLRYASR